MKIPCSRKKKPLENEGCALAGRNLRAWTDATNRETWLGSLGVVVEAPW